MFIVVLIIHEFIAKVNRFRSDFFIVLDRSKILSYNIRDHPIEFAEADRMKKTSYTLNVAGLQRELPLCPLNENLYIGAFVIFGDVELTCACARELLKIAPPHDVLITSESKGIPLVYEMARQAGENKYVVARKMQKLYMSDIFSCDVNSITTAKKQTLYLDGADAEWMRGKRVLIVDDVISTGESLRAIEALVNHAGGNIVGKMAILAEGEAKDREDILYLEPLPLFDADGTALS